jgi:hypothetical protein
MIPAQNRPGSSAKEMLTRHRRERRLDPAIMDAGGKHDPLGVGAADDFKLGLAVHQVLSEG